MGLLRDGIYTSFRQRSGDWLDLTFLVIGPSAIRHGLSQHYYDAPCYPSPGARSTGPACTQNAQ